MLVLLAFWVPLCILPVYDLEPSSLGFFVFYCFIIYMLFTDQKKKFNFWGDQERARMLFLEEAEERKLAREDFKK